MVVIPSSKAYEAVKEDASSSANTDDQEMADLEDNQLKGENMPQIQE